MAMAKAKALRMMAADAKDASWQVASAAGEGIMQGVGAKSSRATWRGMGKGIKINTTCGR